MKKFIRLITILIFIFTLIGCSEKETDSDLSNQDITDTLITVEDETKDINNETTKIMTPQKENQAPSDKNDLETTTTTKASLPEQSLPDPSANTSQSATKASSSNTANTDLSSQEENPVIVPPTSNTDETNPQALPPQDSSLQDDTTQLPPPKDGIAENNQPINIEFELSDLDLSQVSDAQLLVINGIINQTSTIEDLQTSGLFSEAEITTIFGDLLPPPPNQGKRQ